ncbi:MAG: hypothetical protein H6908_06595 [Hyphomicrobiales bacterium]|nr:hypothetical protein [Rickettsiales bacterium]MCP5362280.1 hypothetical protein [Hyphomicrobiales bacterium]
MTPQRPIETQLEQRHYTPPSTNLAQRIALEARDIPQQQHFGIMQWVERLFADTLLLPCPAVALAMALVLGIAVGISLPQETTATSTADVADINAQDFLYIDGETL